MEIKWTLNLAIFHPYGRKFTATFSYFSFFVFRPRKFACFFQFSPTKDLAPCSIHTPQKTFF